ncbi:Predicted membrane protein [Sporobacter termitidis DSM 10068]|uniref:Predicted membrane protein n=1 Tax=Sporobacter termitidis DSM 10068 TaxID=1123282 RepID=A0A1M5TTX3_9FIRM|nr:DUF2318 domain-containing protein [Sporobacter termitidis]SHH54232.1 Predicted membrane protein [Sporobacter termitidis DSM 10068]
MSKMNKRPVKKKTGQQKGIYIFAGALIVVAVVIAIIKGTSGSGGSSSAAAAQNGGDIKIAKSEITETATFIPYKSGNTLMELVAVKAPDGTIRTAFNTCQVCYNSGRGYYIQQGDELVCQNCGNRFKISQVEKEKNGCNPVPILDDGKTDDGQTITVSENYMTQNVALFARWKK